MYVMAKQLPQHLSKHPFGNGKIHHKPKIVEPKVTAPAPAEKFQFLEFLGYIGYNGMKPRHYGIGFDDQVYC